MAFVRVKGPDGSEFTVDEVTAESMGLSALDKAGQPKVSAPKNDTKES